jgi:hypothetical protein
MRTIRGRLDRLESRPDARPGRFVVVRPSLARDGEDPNRIEHWPDGRGVTLHVGYEFGADPMAALTDAQRALVRPGDRVVTIAWVKDWRPKHP